MTTPQQVATTLVCGFLGAGKTTFLRAQLQNSKERTAVLVNEFGELGLDGGTLREVGGLEVVEMNGGCICCSQKLALADTVLQLTRTFQPRRLFIEPSGIAEASEIIRIIESPALRHVVRLDCVITIVDAETFLDYSRPEAFGTFFLDQVGNGDVILINKEDLVEPGVMAEILARLGSLNPAALLCPTSHGKIPIALPARQGRAICQGEDRSPAWEYFSLAIDRPISPTELKELSRRLTGGECGTVLRAKGVIPMTDGSRTELQLVGSRLEMADRAPAVTPRFLCIGFNLDRNRLASCFSAQSDCFERHIPL